MGTNAMIYITDAEQNTLGFYRHGDGDPETVVPDLRLFLTTPQLRRECVSQAAGWLVRVGIASGMSAWKASFYEPTPVPVDSQYTYRVDLTTGRILYTDETTKRVYDADMTPETLERRLRELTIDDVWPDYSPRQKSFANHILRSLQRRLLGDDATA